ncbi:MAG: hypothetical protein K2K60_03660, partial [Clostridia bacterium]|nr:hypothetical protein [Clostridia bacterium]
MKKLKGLTKSANRRTATAALGLSSRRKAIVTGLGAFLCALLVALSFGLLGSTKGRMADAQTQAALANDIQLGELTLSDYSTRQDGKVFNGVVLDKLYNALLAGTGNSGQKTIADFNSVLTGDRYYGSVGLPMYRSAKDLYDANGNKNIVVKFGGYEWTVTFLTRTGEGQASDHIIATLWLTDLLKDTAGNPIYTSMGWATTSASNNANNGGNQNTPYPGDMYSTSKARVETLNAGGLIASAPGSSGTQVAQNPSHMLAKFTMPSAQGSLTNYIVQPNDVKYQHYENWQQQWAVISGNSGTYPLHNEALDNWNGTPGTSTAVAGSWYNNFNYTGKTAGSNGYTADTAYDAWGKDYVWLPSLSETGRIAVSGIQGAIGFWETTYSTSQNTGQTTHTASGYNNGSHDGTNPNVNWQNVQDNTNYAWLRTGKDTHAYRAHYLSGSGGAYIAYTALQLAVRPALHLDLTSAAQAAALETPKDVSQYETTENNQQVLKDIVYKYNTTWQFSDIGKPMAWYDFASYLATNNGTTYAYKSTGDTTAFDTNHPGVTPTNGLRNAGKYKITFTLANNPTYKFAGGATTASFIFTIKQKELDYEPKLYKTVNNNQTAVTLTGNDLFYYGDSNGVVKANVASVNDTGNLGPNAVVYYKGVSGTSYPDMTGQTFNSTTGYNNDESMHQTYGSTTFPSNAGNYQATVVDKNAGTSNYVLKIKLNNQNQPASTNPFSFTITSQGVKLPTLSKSSDDYTGAAQDFSISNYDPAVLDIVSITANDITLTANNGKYTDSDGNYEVTPTLTGSNGYKFTVKDAAKYVVTWKIKQAAETNYEWHQDLNGKAKEIEFTVNKKALTMTLVPPADSNNSWSWGLGLGGKITAKDLAGVVKSDGTNDDPVTFNASYYLIDTAPNATQPAPTVAFTNKAFADIEIAESSFTKTGKYAVWISMYDDSGSGEPNVNRNYTFGGEDTNTNPKTENILYKEVDIGTGKVSVSGIKWQYKEGAAGALSDYPATGLTYKKVNGTSQTYIVEVDASSLPTYMTVDGTYGGGATGFTAGYADNEKSDASTSYTAKVRLKITDTDYKFEQGSSSYTYISDTEAELSFTWKINAKELDFSDAYWDFATNTAQGENDTGANWTKYDTNVQGGQPQYTGMYVFVKISDTYITNLGLSASDISIQYSGSNKQRDAKVQKTSSAYITLSNSNYTLPANPVPFHVDLNWEITNKQIYITGWNGTRTLSGSDGANGTKAFEFPIPTIGNTDSTNYYDMFEYTYEYTINSNTYTGKTETQMIADVYPVATPSVPVTGQLTVKLKSPYDTQYDFNGTTTWPFSVGDSKIVITMGIGGTHTEYADGGDFALTAYEGTTDMFAQLGAGITVKVTDKDSNTDTFTADQAASKTSFFEKAGTYKLDFTLSSAYSSTYALETSTLNYTVARKGIVAPQVIKALTFNGGDITFTDHLDNQYTANTSIIEVLGDNIARNILNGGYSVSLKLLDDNYCWILPERSAGSGKGKIRVSLAADEVATELELSPDLDRAIYSWNVEPLKIDSSKMWKDGQLKLTPELAALVNNGFVGLSYNYYDNDGMLVGNSAEGFKPEGGKAYRIEAVLDGDDADMGNVVFVSSDGSIAGNTSDKVAYTPKKTGMAKFKETLTTKYAGLPLWAWIVIGVCALILLIVLICIIVAACKRRKKKKEEEEAKKEKE